MRRLICATLFAIAICANTGCVLPIYDADPATRARQLIFASEDQRANLETWKRFWFTDQPDHQTPIRTHGGII